MFSWRFSSSSCLFLKMWIFPLCLNAIAIIQSAEKPIRMYKILLNILAWVPKNPATMSYWSIPIESQFMQPKIVVKKHIKVIMHIFFSNWKILFKFLAVKMEFIIFRFYNILGGKYARIWPIKNRTRWTY